MKTFLSPFLLLDEFDSLRLAFSQAKVLRPADLLIQWNVLLNVQETNSLGNILQRKKITVSSHARSSLFLLLLLASCNTTVDWHCS